MMTRKPLADRPSDGKVMAWTIIIAVVSLIAMLVIVWWKVPGWRP